MNVDDLFAALVAEPKKLYALLERLERVAGPWQRSTTGASWEREALLGDSEFSTDAAVRRHGDVWRFSAASQVVEGFATARDARAAADAALIAEGWTLLGPADPESELEEDDVEGPPSRGDAGWAGP